MTVYESWSDGDTREVARKLAESARAGQVFALNGTLGAGKTVFAGGFAAGLGVQRAVTSPTFTVIHEYYEGRLPFYHFDVYRIGHASEMEDTGFRDYFGADGVCLVEWAELIEELLPEDVVRVTIEIKPEKGEQYRAITVEGNTA